MMTLKKLLCLSLVACGLCFSLTGCGNDDNGSTSGNNDNNVVGDAGENIGNAAGDLVEGAGNAVEDVADGVGNAVDDLVGTNGFDNYDDAHKYFLDTMGNYHSDAQFEIRDENRDLTDYQEGSKGYRFKLYDTSKNQDGELFGEFYVDADTGMIYKADGNNFTEYRGTATDDNTTDGNTAKGTGNDASNAATGTGNNTGNATGSGSDSTNTGNGNSGNTNGGNASTAR